MEFDITRKHQLGGETITATAAYLAPVGGSVDLLLPGGTSNMQAAVSLTAANLLNLFIACTTAVVLKLNGTNAVQTATIGGSPTGGTFTITFGGQTTAPIAYNATAATVQAALQLLSSIGTNNIAVTGAAGGPYTLTFVGALAIAPQSTVTGSAAGLTGGTPTLTPASVTTGVVASQTFNLSGANALEWASADGFFANPITSNVAMVSVSNPGQAVGKFQLRAGLSG